MPFLRNWKSNKLYNLSKVYLDQSITNSSDLLKDGIRKARIASLLAPSDELKKDNYLNLLYRLEPTKAIFNWSDSLPDIDKYSNKKIELINKCLDTLSNLNLTKQERVISGRIAIKHLLFLEKNPNWFANPENSLLTSKIHAQVGNTLKAKEIITLSLDKHPNHIDSIFFLVKIIVHLKDTDNLQMIGRKLAELSARRNKTGKDAIRHMTLLHLLQPLSYESLLKCLDLLKANPFSEPIDFMRVYALLCEVSDNAEERNNCIDACSELFNLEDNKDNFIFCNWLNSIGAHAKILQFLSSTKAKNDENLFQLRMNALAKTNDLESIHLEVNNSPSIPLIWRLAIEARAYSLQGNYYETEKILNRLLISIEKDPRKVRSVCNYLETSKDIKGLSHILEQLTDNPIHQNYALKKLIQHRSSSASLEELLSWMSKLSNTEHDDLSFKQTFLYFELLDPLLSSPSIKLDRLLEESKKNFDKNNSSFQNKIILALAQIRNQEPDKAYVSIGPINSWRNWLNARPAWRFIASQVFELNNDSEKSLVLRGNLDFQVFSRAELESFKLLFPTSFSKN